MATTDIPGSHKDGKPPKPMTLVLSALIFAFVASFIVTSLRKYGGFNYFGHTTALSDAVVEAVGAVFVLPLIHLAIASLWKAKRNSRSRRNIFFGWGLAVGVIQLLNVVQMYNFKGTPDAHVTSADRAEVPAPQDEIEEMASVRKSAEQHEAQPAYSHVTTVADPNQSMEGTYCDRLAAVGKSMVNGRDKGTQRTTVETAITNTAEITESERVMYRQMTQAVYDDPSLTEAMMYERIHKACEETAAELTEPTEIAESAPANSLRDLRSGGPSSDRPPQEESERPLRPAGKPVSVTDTRGWNAYLGRLVQANLQGMKSNQPYAYMITPAVTGDQQAENGAQLQGVKYTVTRGVLPGNLLAFCGPSSTATADFVVDAFRDAQPGSFRGVIVVFIGDRQDAERVRVALKPSGAIWRFVEM